MTGYTLFTHKNKIFLILILLLLYGNGLMSQPHYFRHFQVEQGLSHNSVTCSLQDQKGFLWFGTKDGLNRFDGHAFKVFHHYPEDSTSIGSNYIMSLHEREGILWVGTGNGLYQYDPETENFRRIEITLNHEVRDINQDNQGNLWFIAGSNLYKYHVKKGHYKSYGSSHGISATSICRTNNGILWFSLDRGFIAKYQPKSDSFTRFNVFEHSKPVSSTWIEKIYDAGNQQLFIGTQKQGIKLFDIPTSTYKDLLPFDQESSELFVRDIIRNTEDEFWFATESGLIIYKKNSGKFNFLRKSYNDPYSISDNALYTLCRDNEGGIWAGTFFGGLNYSPKQHATFEKLFPKTGENSLSGNAVREICQDGKGNFWIGTEDSGLNKYKPATGKFTNFKPNNSSSGISHFNIHGLLISGNELWIGTFEHGLDVMDIRSGKVIRHYQNGDGPNDLKSNFIYSFYRTQKGEILIATTSGVYQYRPESDDFMLLQDFPAFVFFTTLTNDQEGNLWLGTYRDGLYFKNLHTNKKGYYSYDEKNPHSLASNSVNDIFQDSQQRLWIATEGGLCLFNPEQEDFRRYTTKNGFPSNIVYQILEDKQKHLWISTSKGLVDFDPATEKTKVYTASHGLISNQLNYKSAYKDPTGRMYFGSVKGLIHFNPDEFSQSSFIPPVYLTGFQIHNQEVSVGDQNSPLQKSITYSKQITLNYDQSSFSIDFAALSYATPQVVEYAYILEGLEKDWTYLKANRKVFFTELPPGNYTFKVKASNGSGLWNEEATALQIEILPPFWASLGAYALYALLGLAILYLIIQSYRKKTEKKNKRQIKLLKSQKEKEIYRAKIEFFTNIAHEIRTPLTLIIGPLEQVIQTSKEDTQANENLRIMERNTNRLLTLVNQLLDFRKTETKDFSLSFARADITELIKETYFRFKPAAAQKNLSLELLVQDTPLYAYVDREAIIKILSNLFSNALKYGQSKVQICLAPLSQEDLSFTIEVRNDGYLVPYESRENIFAPFYRIKETENQPGTGIGLPLSRSLAELHNGSLKIKDPENDLNVFVLTIPLHQENEYHLYDEQNPNSPIHDVNKEEAFAAKKPAVLLTEDNREMLDFIAGSLSAEYCVYKALNGKQALEILEKESIQLVVSDLMMPVLDGLELCRQLKSNLEYSHIPIILLTAKNNLESKIEGLESGADAYMDKPFSPEHLRVQIANLLKSRSQIKAYFSSSPLAHIKTMAYSKADESFLEDLNEAIYKNIADTRLNVEQLALIMNISRPTLYRKIKAISDLTPNELINLARLKMAAELLAGQNYKIYEIANMVGYSSQTSFGRNFLKQFGMPPSEYANTKGKETVNETVSKQ